jgi:hypothetical protein
VGAQNDGGGAVIAQATVAQAWETFTLVDINGGSLGSGDSVFVRAGNGQYFQAVNGGGSTLDSASNNTLGWETVKIVRQSGAGSVQPGDVVGLQDSTGTWVSAENGGGGSVFAYGAAMGPWESFVFSTGGGAPPPPPGGPKPVPKTASQKVYVHMMPWFETPATSTDGAWGIHWTMANQSPNIVDSTGRRQIASYYYPEIGPYASGDRDVIEYQLLLMKYAGVDGVLIDWSTTIQKWDYPKNVANAEAIMAKTAAVGLQFAVVYEDNNLALAGVPDHDAQGQADMTYLQNHYWNQPNYIQLDGAPLLLDFGPQAITTPADWTTVMSVVSPKPTFVTLWWASQKAGSNATGEFAWSYSDFIGGLDNWYQNNHVNVKIGVAYPGFNPFYAAGGWGGPTYTLPYNGTGTFAQTLDLAMANTSYIQMCTWNDYGEGTMIEPTRELGYGLLTTLQQTLGVSFGQNELETINTLYDERKQYAGNAAKQAQLDQVFDDLVSLQVAAAQSLL